MLAGSDKACLHVQDQPITEYASSQPVLEMLAVLERFLDLTEVHRQGILEPHHRKGALVLATCTCGQCLEHAVPEMNGGQSSALHGNCCTSISRQVLS